MRIGTQTTGTRTVDCLQFSVTCSSTANIPFSTRLIGSVSIRNPTIPSRRSGVRRWRGLQRYILRRMRRYIRMIKIWVVGCLNLLWTTWCMLLGNNAITNYQSTEYRWADSKFPLRRSTKPIPKPYLGTQISWRNVVANRQWPHIPNWKISNW